MQTSDPSSVAPAIASGHSVPRRAETIGLPVEMSRNCLVEQCGPQHLLSLIRIVIASRADSEKRQLLVSNDLFLNQFLTRLLWSGIVRSLPPLTKAALRRGLEELFEQRRERRLRMQAGRSLLNLNAAGGNGDGGRHGCADSHPVCSHGHTVTACSNQVPEARSGGRRECDCNGDWRNCACRYKDSAAISELFGPPAHTMAGVEGAGMNTNFKDSANQVPPNALAEVGMAPDSNGTCDDAEVSITANQGSETGATSAVQGARGSESAASSSTITANQDPRPMHVAGRGYAAGKQGGRVALVADTKGSGGSEPNWELTRSQHRHRYRQRQRQHKPEAALARDDTINLLNSHILSNAAATIAYEAQHGSIVVNKVPKTRRSGQAAPKSSRLLHAGGEALQGSGRDTVQPPTLPPCPLVGRELWGGHAQCLATRMQHREGRGGEGVGEGDWVGIPPAAASYAVVQQEVVSRCSVRQVEQEMDEHPRAARRHSGPQAPFHSAVPYPPHTGCGSPLLAHTHVCSLVPLPLPPLSVSTRTAALMRVLQLHEERGRKRAIAKEGTEAVAGRLEKETDVEERAAFQRSYWGGVKRNHEAMMGRSCELHDAPGRGGLANAGPAEGEEGGGQGGGEEAFTAAQSRATAFNASHAAAIKVFMEKRLALSVAAGTPPENTAVAAIELPKLWQPLQQHTQDEMAGVVPGSEDGVAGIEQQDEPYINSKQVGADGDLRVAGLRLFGVSL